MSRVVVATEVLCKLSATRRCEPHRAPGDEGSVQPQRPDDLRALAPLEDRRRDILGIWVWCGRQERSDQAGCGQPESSGHLFVDDRNPAAAKTCAA